MVEEKSMLWFVTKSKQVHLASVTWSCFPEYDLFADFGLGGLDLENFFFFQTSMNVQKTLPSVTMTVQISQAPMSVLAILDTTSTRPLDLVTLNLALVKMAVNRGIIFISTTLVSVSLWKMKYFYDKPALEVGVQSMGGPVQTCWLHILACCSS